MPEKKVKNFTTTQMMEHSCEPAAARLSNADQDDN